MIWPSDRISYTSFHMTWVDCSAHTVRESSIQTPSDSRLKGSVHKCILCSPLLQPFEGCDDRAISHTNGLMGLVNYGWSMPIEKRTIVDYLNDAGYETVHAGIQHERTDPATNRYQLELGDPSDRLAKTVIDSAIDYLRRRKPCDKPFYLNIGTIEVHGILWLENLYEATPEVAELDYPEIKDEDVYIPPHIPDNVISRKNMKRLMSTLLNFDAQFGRLLDAIDEAGLRDNTIVVLTTDHGISGTRAKGTLYDRGVETTLIYRYPRQIRSGMIVDELISNIDNCPTLLEAAGVPTPEAVQGKSYWSLFTGGEYVPHHELFIERNDHGSMDPVRAVRTRKYHLIKNFDDRARRYYLPDEFPDFARSRASNPGAWRRDPRPELELYDVENDPRNTKTWPIPSRSTVAELLNRMYTWMLDTEDPVLKGSIPLDNCDLAVRNRFVRPCK